MTVYLCGDSTCANYAEECFPQTGWGQLFPTFLKEDVTVDNRATNARSSKSFIGEGRLTRIEETLQKGDYLFIQFTHNDSSNLIWRHTEPYGSFLNHLNVYIDTALQYGAQPVLLTPICRRSFDTNGQYYSAHGNYVPAIHHLAKHRGVPLIDLYAASAALIQELGSEKSKPLYMTHVDDNTHTTIDGARAFAQMVAKAVFQSSLPLKHLVKEDLL